MLGQSKVSPVSHGPCTQQITFCNDAALHGFWGHPVLAHCVPKGAELTSLRGGVPFRTLTCRLSSFAIAATV